VVADDVSMSKAIGTILRTGGFTPLTFASALSHVAKLPDLDWGTVRLAAHSLGNYMNITAGCVQLLGTALAGHPDEEVHGWLRTLERTTELMISVSRPLTNASAASDVPLHFEKVDLALLAQRATAFYETVAKNKYLQFLCQRSGPAYAWADRVATNFLHKPKGSRDVSKNCKLACRRCRNDGRRPGHVWRRRALRVAPVRPSDV